MKIIQIVVSPDNSLREELVYGLGDDNKVYFWSRSKLEWIILD